MKQILYFLGGAAAGAALTYFFTKRYYEGIIDDEIASVKEAYQDEHVEHDDGDKVVKKYHNIVKGLDYVDEVDDLVSVDVDEETGEVVPENPFPGEPSEYPYVIEPDTYHDENGIFDKETLTYYDGNDTLVTDEDEVLDINSTIGRENLDRFGEFEDSTVFVRNEKLGMDFEVVYVEGEYETVD
jgi:hypothetical protein